MEERKPYWIDKADLSQALDYRVAYPDWLFDANEFVGREKWCLALGDGHPNDLGQLEELTPRQVYEVLLRFYGKTEAEVPWQPEEFAGGRGMLSSFYLHHLREGLYRELRKEEQAYNILTAESISAKRLFNLLYRLRFGEWPDSAKAESKPQVDMVIIDDVVKELDPKTFKKAWFKWVEGDLKSTAIGIDMARDEGERSFDPKGRNFDGPENEVWIDEAAAFEKRETQGHEVASACSSLHLQRKHPVLWDGDIAMTENRRKK